MDVTPELELSTERSRVSSDAPEPLRAARNVRSGLTGLSIPSGLLDALEASDDMDIAKDVSPLA
jgi:hypothetical protein